MSKQVIDKFDGEYAFLSNFYDAPVTYGELSYLNSESAFQAQKQPSKAEFFTELPPNKAKRMGRRVDMRSDWDDVKYDHMLNIVRNKFNQNKDIAEQLIATGDTELIEGNWWKDTYWGVCEGVGTNYLGIILMQVRDELTNK